MKLIVAGEFYENKEPYFDLVKKLKIEDHIIFTDSFVKTEDVKYYFSASDLVAQTYRTATQSGVTQIAYHFECPMLVTNVGGLAEIVPHNKVGYLVEKNPEDIAEHINEFFEKNKKGEFSTNVAKLKFNFSWENIIDGIKSFFIDNQ